MRNVVLFDSHPVILTGLREFLGGLGKDFVFFETNTISGVSQYLSQHKIDLVVAGLNEKAGIDSRLVAKYRTIRWVIMYNDNLYKKALSLMLSGAIGCISKACRDDEAEACIRDVLAARPYICQTTLQKFGYEFIFDPINHAYIRNFLKYNFQRKPNTLSAREHEVATLLVTGMKTSEIAALLKIRNSTVSTIKRTIMLKKM
ncbi:response regulator transcription factor [Dyadobacter sp. 676]|uniref:Response regulator transcription factor n=1 Tax=Dyadobacter sp. 676 TaxID=3088362 RepID=A0AAU8FGL2_9BACT